MYKLYIKFSVIQIQADISTEYLIRHSKTDIHPDLRKNSTMCFLPEYLRIRIIILLDFFIEFTTCLIYNI